MPETSFLVPADPGTPGVHALAQDDGSVVVITALAEAMTIAISEPD